MLRVLLDENLTVIRTDDNSVYIGQVVEIKSPHIGLKFQQDTDLKPGDQVKCGFTREGSYASVVAQVTEINGRECGLWMLVQNIIPGVDRAPRAVAPGTTVTMTVEDSTVIGSLCDISESGLRVRSLGRFEVGQELHLHMETELGSIAFDGRIARVVHGVENESSDAGIQITYIEKLERARYNHFVDGLLRRAKKAS